jgi:cell pole-organizing protein PopZ
MEEILASIRSIIADDRSQAANKPQPAARPVSTTPQVIYSNFGLKPQEAPAMATFRSRPDESQLEAESDVPEFDAPEAEDAAAAFQAAPAPAFDAAPEPEAPLMSVETDREVGASFQALAASLAAPDPQRVEEMTRDLLRPMLKSWLDENLPSLVERLVKAEIQRVARGGR